MKTKLITICLLGACLLSAAPAKANPSGPPLYDAEREAFFATMRERLSGVTSLRSAFVQTRKLSLFMDTLVTTGTILFQAPDRLRWETRRPYASVLIANGRKVARYDYLDGERRRLGLGSKDAVREVFGQIKSWMRGDFSGAEEMYDIAVRRGREFQVVLSPRSEQLKDFMESITLFIDTETMRARRVLIREPRGDEVEIAFIEPVENLPLDPNLFDLSDPAPLEPGKD